MNASGALRNHWLVATALALVATTLVGKLAAERQQARTQSQGIALALADEDKHAEARELRARDPEARQRGEDRVEEGAERRRDDDRQREERGQHDRDEHLRERIENRQRELDERAQHIERELERARDEGREGAVKELEHALEMTRHEHRRLEEHLHGSDQERMRDHLKRLKQEIQRHREAGHLDEARALEQKARELYRDLAERREHDEPYRDKPIDEVEMHRRARHLNAAADNLAAAGLHEQAEMVRRQVQRIMQSTRHEGREGDGPPAHDARPDRPGVESAQREVQQLRQQMERMQHQMEEMREVLKRLVDQRREQDRPRD